MASAVMQFASVTTELPPNGHSTITTSIGAGGRVSVDGALDGPGDPTVGLDSIWRDLSILYQFFLDVQSMPEEGCTFDSSPVARLTGDVTAYSVDTSWWDDPSAECFLRSRQLVFAGTQQIAAASRNITIISFSNTDGLDRAVLEPIFRFEPVTFDLDRSQSLIIHLELIFRMHVEGEDSYVMYDAWADSRPVTVRVPQFSIDSLD
jgi:hypothetical protein